MQRLIRRGYNIGGGMTDPSRTWFYLSIPKNASTYTGNLLKYNDWEWYNVNQEHFQKAVIVLRDPLDRWISGISQYLCSYILGKDYGSDHLIEDYNELSHRLIFDNLIFDDHTTPQINFINLIPNHIQKYYIWANRDTLVDSLCHVVGTTLKNNQDLLDNSKESNYDTNNLSNFFKSRLTINEKKKIYDLYREDYDLVNSVNIHGTR